MLTELTFPLVVGLFVACAVALVGLLFSGRRPRNTAVADPATATHTDPAGTEPLEPPGDTAEASSDQPAPAPRFAEPKKGPAAPLGPPNSSAPAPSSRINPANWQIKEPKTDHGISGNQLLGPKPLAASAVRENLVFFDVETTGLKSEDRIVTLAAVKISGIDAAASQFSLEYMHLIFDPGRKSHPRAEAVHGYSDWTLRHQDNFIDYAEAIETFFDSADLVIAHNAPFDLDFYNREMLLAGRAPLSRKFFCTMSSYRERSSKGASLNSVCAEIGIARSTNSHSALEDAWLAMRVYFWLHQHLFSANLPPEFRGGPSNFKPVPPLPAGPLPRRRRKRASFASNLPATP